MPFTEFFCQGTGNNLNSGSTNSDNPRLTYASGSWVSSTGVFTVASGNPLAEGVEIGEFASVYPDGVLVTPFVGIITAVDNTTITVSLTIKSGTAPSNGSNNTTLRIGGAWTAPSNGSGFPFNFVAGIMRKTTDSCLRVNLRNDVVYLLTSGATTVSSLNHAIIFQGYGDAPGDKQHALIQGLTTGASYNLLFANATAMLIDMIFENNGDTGSMDGVVFGGNKNYGLRLVFRNFMGAGVKTNNGVLESCQAYNNNRSLNTTGGGFKQGSTSYYYNCLAHNNYNGFVVGIGNTGGVFNSCSYNNQNHGFVYAGSQTFMNIGQCNAFNNRGHAIHLLGSGSYQTSFNIWNSNFANHGGYGIAGSGSINGVASYRFYNCGFQDNASGNFQSDFYPIVDECNSINYADTVDIWNNPRTGDFRLKVKTARNVPYQFTQVFSTNSGTISYDDIGAISTLNNDELLTKQSKITRIQQ